MRSLRHSVLWQHLALMAMLLLALLPTLGRLQPPSAASQASTPLAICTMDGLREAWLPAAPALDAAVQPGLPEGDHPTAHDCEYCPLLASLLLALACLLALQAPARSPATHAPRTPSLAPRRAGANARGPPLSA